jgi:hypothetical protein
VKFEQAQAYLEQALRVCRECGNRRGEGWAHYNLGTAYLPLGEFAQTEVDEILAYLTTQRTSTGLEDGLAGLDDPGLVFLSCYHVLQANRDARAQAILSRAYQLLQKRAATISDETQWDLFWENVVVHREIRAVFDQTTEKR